MKVFAVSGEMYYGSEITGSRGVLINCKIMCCNIFQYF